MAPQMTPAPLTAPTLLLPQMLPLDQVSGFVQTASAPQMMPAAHVTSVPQMIPVAHAW